jgi:tetratricopeptide (TPR) repeat protein
MSRQYPERGLFLIRQARPAKAVEELLEGLRETPGDAYVHAVLAIAYSNLGRGDDALRAAQESVGLAPHFAYAYYAHAWVLLARNRADEAEEAAREAVRLDPYHPAYHAQLATTFLRRQRWAEALEAADRGLEVAPEDVRCANDRATALANLGRAEEAVETLRRALSHDPESSETHTNLGWRLLDRGDPHEALGHFREALRLDPRSESAREGLAEAVTARNPVYAGFLRHFLGPSRMDSSLPWTFIFGIMVFLGLLREEDGSGEVPVLVILLLALAVLALLASGTARPVLHLALLRDPLGREILSRRERIGAKLMGGALLLTAASWLALGVALFYPSGPSDDYAGYYAYDWVDGTLAAALVTTGLLVPLSLTLRAPGVVARTVLAVLTGVLYVCAAALVVYAGYPHHEERSVGLYAVTGMGILLAVCGMGFLGPDE